MELLSAIGLLMGLLTIAWLAHAALPHLPEAHRSRDTLDMVRLSSGFVITSAALVLGLLIASVNTAFFESSSSMNALAGGVRQTDSCLQDYGPAADPQRQILRRYVVGVLKTTWPEEPLPASSAGQVEPSRSGFENLALGDELEAIRLGLIRLTPADDEHRQLRSLCLEEFSKLLDSRWKLIGEAHGTISAPFFRILVLMIAIVFACFGLNAPRNLLAWTSIGLAALTIAISIYVVLELDSPLDGVIKVSSAAMRSALAHFDR